MDIEKQIKEVLFQIGQTIKLHKMDEDNVIVEIDYERYTADIMRIFVTYLSE